MVSLKKWIKSNIITTIAIIFAIITCFFVPIDYNYINYFDFKTLGCLTCVLAVVQCLKDSQFFDVIAKKFVSLFKDVRSIIVALVVLTIICDLLLANDMSLITLLPLTYIILKNTNNMKYYGLTLILQNIAANMSGMITPHGNPQNLYLYSYYDIPTLEFVQILLPHFLIIILLLVLLPFLIIKKESIELSIDKKNKFDKKIYAYIILFVFSLLIIFRIVPYILGFIVVMISVYVLNKSALVRMDWDLILTFCAFFVFSGNISRIPAISSTLKLLINKNELIAGIISCQFISNVPTAILLSKFTADYKSLVVASNIGSLGTLISSLASLITLKEYMKHEKNVLNYIIKFTLISLSFLIIMLLYIYLSKIW